MKVIFLDIDGVLNDHNKHSNGYCGFKQSCVDNLNLILDRVPDVYLIISSAWRYMVPDAMKPIGFEYLLLVAGVNCKGRILGFTPKDEVIKTRGKQILYALRYYPITEYVILDDLTHDFVKFGLAANFVLVDGSLGLTQKQALHIIKLLE